MPLPQRPPVVQIMRKLNLEPDPWQLEVLESEHPRMLLNCCRQAGKSTVVGILALVQALFRPFTKVLILSRSHRQAKELLKTIVFHHRILGEKMLVKRTVQELELANFSRIICLPCREDTIRGYSKVDLIVLDEAARVPDDLYRAVRPMLAVSGGRLVCLSTPFGKRGFFWNEWAKGGEDWLRIEVPAEKVPRIEAGFLEAERRSLGEVWFRQEYQCSFEAVEGLVFPNFNRSVVDELPEHVCAGQKNGQLRQVGGIDFGFRNPFAAVWGVVDRDDVLWITNEHYCRYQPLSHHARFLPREVCWYADPSGAGEIRELRCAGFKVVPGKNPLRLGISALHARLAAGTLKTLKGKCTNLLAEAHLYRFGGSRFDQHPETPVDEHNHALAALRYLIMALDARRLGRPAAFPKVSDETASAKPAIRDNRTAVWAERVEDDRLWMPLA